MTPPGPSPACWKWASRISCWPRPSWGSWPSAWCASSARNAASPCRPDWPAEEWRQVRPGAAATLREPAQLFMGQGCPACAHTGYRGRTGIYELVLVEEPIRELIIQRADAGTMRQKATSLGMQTLAGDGWRKVAQGFTTVQEVLRVTQE